jgi:hypothetical protein
VDSYRARMYFVKITATTVITFTNVNACLTQYPYFLTYLVKFGIEDLHEMPLIQSEFRKNLCNEKPYFPVWWPRNIIAPA